MKLKLVWTLGIITISTRVASVSFGETSEVNYILSDEFIEETNRRANGLWTAKRNFNPNTPTNYFLGMMGVHPDNHLHLPAARVDNYSEEELATIPTQFDPREEWSQCPSISVIWDQGGCGSCWAFGATSAMSDRLCIHSPNNEVKILVSPEQVLSCCLTCGFGCNGGHTSTAWDYWHRTGVVTGGLYGSQDTCQPYEIEPCEHHVDGDRPPCGSERTPRCHKTCQDNYEVPFDEDKTYGQRTYSIRRNPETIQMELMTNGPVEASFRVFEDFVNYKEGVYQHVHGSYLGGHAVRMLGWGEENGTPYWLVANSWNTDWGDNGTFKIMRGGNECGIEAGAVAAMPDFERTHFVK